MAYVSIKQLSDETGLTWQTIEISTCVVNKHMKAGTLVMDRAEAIMAISEYCKRKAQCSAVKAKEYGKGSGVEKRSKAAKESAVWVRRSVKVLSLLKDGGDAT